MITIHSSFIGGNIQVKEINGDTVLLDNELRDSGQDWFYWAFCIEGAAGRTLTFQFPKHRLGYWGPAVSHDLVEWHWLNDVSNDAFCYRFEAHENKVYFAHSPLYHPDRFFGLCRTLGLTVDELCKSRKGRSVPCLHIGNGNKSILLTARHHACESPGSYVLEGVLQELTAHPMEDTRILVVPFVDLDGVIEGDQGKARVPHDHNGDYAGEPLYPEARAIRDYATEFGCHYALDLHAPWHRGAQNDHVFVVRKCAEKLDRFERLSALLEAEVTPSSMQYQGENDHAPDTGWNKSNGPGFASAMNKRPENILAFALENTYFGTADNVSTPDRLIELGKCFIRAIKKYDNEVTP